MGRLTTRQLATRRRDRKAKSSKRPTLQPGDMLQERYRVVGTLGVGGFSSVYQARDMRFQNATKLCAVKEMVITTQDPKMRELTIKSFEREASMLAMLDHPSIPAVTDYFTEGDRSYLVLDLIRGKDLEAWLENQTEPLAMETAVSWMIQLCEALIYLHNSEPNPIVFRDMKPSNIMLDHLERIRLIDFNIAKVFESDAKGTMIGTEGYCPPEQYRGQSTPLGDIYAMGATFHHLLTQQDPRLEPPFTFNERPIAKMNQTVTPEFDAVLNRCLAYDPAERYQTAEALQDALRGLLEPKTGRPQADGAAATAAGTGSPSATGVPVVKKEGSQPEPLWVFQCEDEIRSKAAVTKDFVFVSAYDNNLYALTAANGEFAWKYPTGDGVGASPYVYKDAVYISSADERVYAIDITTGKLNWRFATKGSIYSSPVVRFDHLFIGSDDKHVYAINIKRGKEVWKVNAYGAVRSTPFVTDEHIYFGTEGGYVYCLELSSGKNKWQMQAKRAVTSSPIVVDDIVVVGSLDATVYALDASSGWAIWRARTRRPIVSSPVVHNDVVYIGSADKSLYAFDLDTGRQIWSYETAGQVSSSPAVWGDAVYFGSTDGKVYSLDAKKGKLRWQFQTGGPVISSPVVLDGIVYIGSADHNFYALPA